MLGFCPRKLSLYKIALTHHSYKHLAKGKRPANNERLEYLGDALLGLVVAEKLFHLYPSRSEGFLTEMRSKIVNRQQLSQIGLKMGIADLMRYDYKLKRENKFVETIVGNSLEALIGAILLDKGYAYTKKYIQRFISQHLDLEKLSQQEISYKAVLNRWAQGEHKKLEFIVKNIDESTRIKIYEVGVMLDGEEQASAKNHSKKIAEELASAKMCKMLGME